MRVQCAQCHNHPFDRWTMDDYYSFAAFFAQIGRKQAEDPREQIIFDRRNGEVKHPVDGRNMAPRFLGGATPEVRAKIAASFWPNGWLPARIHTLPRTWRTSFGPTSSAVASFTRSMTFVSATRPSIPELLEALGQKFIEYNYDFRRLVRDICVSRTYQASTQTNESNRLDTTNFSHATLRRMRAEVLLDAISQVTDTRDKFAGLPLGARATQIADGNTSDYFLTTFGRAKRETVCSCEVKMEPNLSQALHLLNGNTIQRKIREGKLVRKWLEEGKSSTEIIEELYIRCLCRKPTDKERETPGFACRRKTGANASRPGRSVLGAAEFPGIPVQPLAWTVLPLLLRSKGRQTIDSTMKTILPGRCFMDHAVRLQRQLLCCGILLCGYAPGWTADEPDKPEVAKVTYDDDVKPILQQKCFSCHNADRKSGDLDLTNYTNLMLGGGSGKVVEAGASSDSYLFQLITHEEEPYMPPESPKIPDDMLEVVRKWIDGGLLENRGSQARIVQRKSVAFALQDVPSDRPSEPPVPGRLPLEPVLHTRVAPNVAALATNPWSPIAAVAGTRQVVLYDLQSQQLRGILPFEEGVPEVLRFSRNGALLLAGGGRAAVHGQVVVWDIKTGERVFEVGDELDAVLAADISSDQRWIALGGPQKIVRIYSTETGQLTHELRKHTDWIFSLEFSPDGVLLATGDRAGNLFVWEAWTGREYLTLSGHTAAVTAVSWRADSNLLASVSEDGTTRLWEMENGKEVRKWNAHGSGVLGLEFTRDGRILTCGRDKTAKLFDSNGKQLIQFPPANDLAVRATFCDETNQAVVSDWTGTIQVWNAADGSLTASLTANPPPLSQRLREATQQLAQREGERAAAEATWEAAQTLRDELAERIEEMRDRLQAREESVVRARQAVEAATADVDAARAAVDRWTEEIRYAKELPTAATND